MRDFEIINNRNISIINNRQQLENSCNLLLHQNAFQTSLSRMKVVAAAGAL